MKTLTFVNIKDQIPADGQEILFMRCSEFYGYISPEIGVAEYCWFEYEEGEFTGCQISYDPDEPTPDGCKLHVMIGNQVVSEDNLWWTASDNLDQFYPEEETCAKD